MEIKMGTIIIMTCSLALVSMVTSVRATYAKYSPTDTVNFDSSLFFQLLNRVETLEQRDRDQQTDINKLRTELLTEKRRTSILERIFLDLLTRDGKASTSSEEATDNVGQTMYPDTKAGNANDNVGDTSSGKTAMKLGSRIRRHEGLPVVAFHASLTNDLHHTGVHQLITFDNVITNVGAAYNPHLGSFIAPVPGLYVFHTTIMGYSTHVLHVSIVKNESSVANFYIRGTESVFGNGGAMVIVHLNKGDDVAVQNNDLDKSVSGDHFSMFSGFLLHEDHPTESIVGK